MLNETLIKLINLEQFCKHQFNFTNNNLLAVNKVLLHIFYYSSMSGTVV